MEFKDIMLIKNINPPTTRKISKVKGKVKTSRKRNRPKGVIISKIIKKFMELSQVQQTIKIKEENGQLPANQQNLNYLKPKN